jgi:DNA-3-methyladenine glycosylase
MFGPPGHAYVYFIYGNHWCFNAVCSPSGTAEAVLLRAIEPSFGVGWMQQRRPVAKARDLTNGPAKFCAALAIDRELDHADLCDDASPIQIAENPERAQLLKQRGPIITTTRVGLSQAADWPLRFYLEGSVFVSRRAVRVAATERRLPRAVAATGALTKTAQWRCPDKNPAVCPPRLRT